MEEKKESFTFKFKDSWHDIIKFLDVSDLFNLELVNRELREKINNAYIQRNNDNKLSIEEKYKKNKRVNKKKFFEYYMNSFINFGVGDIEFNNEIENSKNQEYDSNKKTDYKEGKSEKVDTKEGKGDKGEASKINPQIIDESNTAIERENRIFYK